MDLADINSFAQGHKLGPVLRWPLGLTEGRRPADACLLQHLPHLAVITLSQSPHAKWNIDRKPPLSGEQR